MEETPAASAAAATAAESRTGWVDQGLSRRQVRFTLAGVMLAMFLASLDQTIVATALPRIIADLGGFDRFTWITTSYIVASTTVVPLAGAVADVYGRKWLYVGGIAVFLAGSVLSALAQSMDALIAARAVQGLGGGAMMALSFVAIGDLFPPAERGKFQGIIAGMFGISSVLGPTIGGFLTDHLSWHWIFYVNLPLGIPVLLLFMRFFPNVQPSGQRKVDYAGAVLMVFMVVPALLAISWGGTENAWTSAEVLIALAVSAVSAVAFVWVEMRVPDPILPFQIFRDRVVAVSMVAIVLTGFAMFGATTFMPLLFQGVLGASATASGSFLTPMMLGVVFGAATSGQVLSRTGGHYRIQGVAGLAIMCVGLGILAGVSAQTTYAAALSGAVIMGIGLGTTFPLYTIAVQNAVSHRYLGVATSATQFFRSIGGSVGLALFGAFLVNRFEAHLAEGLPVQAREVVTPAQLEQITDNPNALVDPNALSSLRNVFESAGPDGAAMVNSVLEALKAALADSIGDIFALALIFVLIALGATLFLKEIPLSGRGRRKPGAEQIDTGQPEAVPVGGSGQVNG